MNDALGRAVVDAAIIGPITAPLPTTSASQHSTPSSTEPKEQANDPSQPSQLRTACRQTLASPCAKMTAPSVRYSLPSHYCSRCSVQWK